jgi:hypothetical protein
MAYSKKQALMKFQMGWPRNIGTHRWSSSTRNPSVEVLCDVSE